MMKCPKCETVYYDDIAFCLEDGTPLIADAVEQETLVRKPFPVAPTQLNIACSVCGLANHVNSKLCQRCGAVFPHHEAYTIPAQPGTNAVPEYAIQSDPTSSSTANKNVLIAILGVLSLVLVGVIFFMASGGGIIVKPDNRQTIANNANNSATNNSNNDNNTVVQKNKNKPVANKSEDLDLDMGDPVPTYPAALPNGKEKTFKGYSSVPLTLHLTRNGSALSGRAITPGDLDYLDGDIDTDGNFVLDGENEREGYVTGVWRGRVNPDGSIKGVWTSNSGKRIPFTAN